MKKIILLFLVAGIASGSAFAHGGRTDKNGGHTDKETGKYHKH